MHKRLSYADAVTVLGGTGPGWELLDRVLGGVLLTATGGGSAVALSLFDAKNEFTRFGRSVTSGLRDRVHGLGRFDRTERLYAAHTVLAVTAFFDALDACDLPFDPRSVSLHRGEQLAVAGAPGGAGWLDQLSMVPAPSPGRSADDLAADMRAWYAHLANRLAEYLTGLALWDVLTEGGRMRTRALLQDVVPAAALRHYEEMRLRLAADHPEYALWSQDLGDRAMHDRLRSIGQGLTALENLLREVTTGRRPGNRCAALSAVYRAELDQPIVAGGAGDIVVPRLGDIYIDPLFRARRAVPGDPVAREDWWATVPVRDDLSSFLAAHLTSADAVTGPLVVLGQPGAGKSAFTRVVAARLPAADFLPVRVPLRDVPAESDVLDQPRIPLAVPGPARRPATPLRHTVCARPRPWSSRDRRSRGRDPPARPRPARADRRHRARLPPGHHRPPRRRSGQHLVQLRARRGQSQSVTGANGMSSQRAKQLFPSSSVNQRTFSR